MTLLAPTVSTPRADEGRVSIVRIFVLESRAECLRLLRMPAFAVPVLLFPLMFYALFGVLLGARAGADAARPLLAAFLVFGVMAPGLFGLGVTLAMDRERGFTELKRALPLPPGIYLGAKVAMAMMLAAMVSTLVMLLAVLAGRVALTLMEACLLLALAVLGVVPFCALGLLIGSLAKGQAAPAVLNLLYLPMSFLSGVLLPFSLLPHFVAQLAPLWPAYHVLQLALRVVGVHTSGTAGGHILSLAGMTVLFLAIARGRLIRQG
jgi:ABC-2 type transport system permease protein